MQLPISATGFIDIHAAFAKSIHYADCQRIKNMKIADKQEPAKAKILVVDDEELICSLIKYNLEAEGYDVDVCYSAEEALAHDFNQYALLIADIMMGEMNGVKMVHKIKQTPRTASIPVIFCSAKDKEEDIIDGLSSGADDYIAKPFSLRELVARVNAVISRHRMENSNQQEAMMHFDGLDIDLLNRSVFIGNELLPLTITEYNILALFLKNANRFFSRKEIFEFAWDGQAIVSERAIDVNISRLRKKLGTYASHIVSRAGFGYGFFE